MLTASSKSAVIFCCLSSIGIPRFAVQGGENEE